MARLDEITSTERLLAFIRKKKDEPTPDDEVSLPEPPLPVLSTRRSSNIIPIRKVSLHKPVTVGVDIGHEYLRFVKTVKTADDMSELVDHRGVLIPAGIRRDSAEFVNFLSDELDSFCGTARNQQLWAIMSAARVEVHHMRIPKVPRKQIENVLYWSVKKETPFDENENIFDFEVLGEVIEQGIAKWAVMYYTAPKQDIEEAKKLFSRAGRPLTGLSIVPFAVQNIIRARWMAGYEGTVASLFIGNDFSRIDIYSHGDLVMTRGIKAGISSMVECLMEGLNERPSLSGGGGEVGTALDKNKAREIFFSLSPDAPDSGLREYYKLQEAEIWESVMPAMERLARQVERTFEHFTINLGNEKVDKIIVSSAMDVYPPLAEYVGSQLGMASDIFDPLNTQPLLRSEADAMFASVSERIAFAPALGMALSDNTRTPNFIFTYKDKEGEASVKRINMVIFVAFLATVVICGGVFLYQLRGIAQKNKTMEQLEQQLAGYKPPLSQEVIMKTLAVIQQDAALSKAYSQKHLGLAVISELANLASPNVRLISLRVKLGSLPEKPQESAPAKVDAAQGQSPKGTSSVKTDVAAKPKEEMKKEIEMEGVVTGDKRSLDTLLANYIMQLDNSLLFQDIKVHRTNEESFRKATLLRFNIGMKVEGI